MAAFCDYLEAKIDSADHVKLTVTRLQIVCKGCGFCTLRDLEGGKVAEWLKEARHNGRPNSEPHTMHGVAKTYRQSADAFNVAERTGTYWRDQGAPITPRHENDLANIATWLRKRKSVEQGMSIATSNHYLGAVKSFGAWLVRERRWPENPFRYLSKLNANADIRRERRAIDRFGQLVSAARSSDRTFRGLTGSDRAMLYITATYTGLRARELASLEESSFDLESESPTVMVEAAYSKRRQKDIQPLRPDLAQLIREWLAQRRAKRQEACRTLRFPSGGPNPDSNGKQGSSEKLWPGTWYKYGAQMLRRDLAVAGIPYRDEAGRIFDFHALRHQFISDLATGGVHPKIAQTLARHSTIALTMDSYTHVSVANVVGALDHLPALPSPVKGDWVKATGTDGGNFGDDLVNDSPSQRGHRGHQLSTTEAPSESGQETHKPLTGKGFGNDCPPVSASDSSEADGTRTRNHRIDSPVL